MVGLSVLAGNGAVARSLDDFTPTRPPRPAPDLTFVDAEGRQTSLKDFAGKVVLVNVWATWCQPCVKEMPALDRLQGALGGPDFQVVAVSVDRGGARVVEPFFAKLGLTRLPMYLDPQSGALRAFQTRGLPTSILIDRSGQEVGRLEGDAEWDGPEAQSLIRGLMNKGGPARGSGVVKTGG